MSNRIHTVLAALLVVTQLGIFLMLSSYPGANAAQAEDDWSSVATSIWGPAEYFDAVTPSDTVDLPRASRGLYSHDGGNIACRGKNGTSAVFLFAAGEIKPIRCWRVLVTGTDSATIRSLR